MYIYTVQDFRLYTTKFRSTTNHALNPKRGVSVFAWAYFPRQISGISLYAVTALAMYTQYQRFCTTYLGFLCQTSAFCDSKAE